MLQHPAPCLELFNALQSSRKASHESQGCALSTLTFLLYLRSMSQTYGTHPPVLVNHQYTKSHARHAVLQLVVFACGQSTFGINLIRFWGAINGNGIVGGYGFTDTTDKSIMISIDPVSLQGTYNETGFRRFDLALDAACKLPFALLWCLHYAAILHLKP